MSEVQQAGPGDSAARSMVDALVRTRRTGLAATAALGGLALVAALATKALRGAPAMQSGDPKASDPKASDPKSTDTKAPAPPGATPFDHIAVAEDEARTMLRAMVAATLADGLVDAGERKRLDDALSAAGIEADGRRWLEAELADPADVDAIAERATNPEQAARIYAAGAPRHRPRHPAGTQVPPGPGRGAGSPRRGDRAAGGGTGGVSPGSFPRPGSTEPLEAHPLAPLAGRGDALRRSVNF